MKGGLVDSTERVERLLALLLLAQFKSATQREKVLQLNLAGFSNIEIAELLQTTPAVVSQNLYEAKRSKTAKRTTTASAEPKKPSARKRA